MTFKHENELCHPNYLCLEGGQRQSGIMHRLMYIWENLPRGDYVKR